LKNFRCPSRGRGLYDEVKRGNSKNFRVSLLRDSDGGEVWTVKFMNLSHGEVSDEKEVWIRRKEGSGRIG
jgi:hypothetical protein